jgi:hypothetical protein
MSAVRTSGRTDDLGTTGQTDRNPARRLTTETKAAFKTTELIAFVVAVAGVLIAASIVDESNAGGLGAEQAWLYVTPTWSAAESPSPAAATPTPTASRRESVHQTGHAHDPRVIRSRGPPYGKNIRSMRENPCP